MREDADEIQLEEANGYFPIRTLSIKTGVNSVTLRAWERRYGLLKPKRTAKGHRLYSEADVVRVESIVRWIQQGVAVGKVRALLDREGQEEEFVVSPAANEWLDYQAQLVDAANALNEDKIERLYQQIFSQYPSRIAVKHWILPSLDQLGVSTYSRFCEAVLSGCLSNRLASLKAQNSTAEKSVLISGFMSQRVLWSYMVAAIVSDQGLACHVLPNMVSGQDWLHLAEQLKPKACLVFCEAEQAAAAADLVDQFAALSIPTSLIGPSFWLVANESNMTSQSQVRVYSDGLEGVFSLLQSMTANE